MMMDDDEQAPRHHCLQCTRTEYDYDYVYDGYDDDDDDDCGDGDYEYGNDGHDKDDEDDEDDNEQAPLHRCLQCTRTEYDGDDDEYDDYGDGDHLSSHTPFNGVKGESRTASFPLKKRVQGKM